MKLSLKIFPLFLIPFYPNGQSIKSTQADKITVLLCHEWNVNKDSGSSKKSKDSSLKAKIIFPSELNSTVVFMPNGTVKFDLTTGSWKYKKENNQLIIELKNKTTNYSIIKLTKKELILENSVNGLPHQILFWRED